MIELLLLFLPSVITFQQPQVQGSVIYSHNRGPNYGQNYEFGYNSANPSNPVELWFNQFFGGKDFGNNAFKKFVKQSKKGKTKSRKPGKPSTPHDDSAEEEELEKISKKGKGKSKTKAAGQPIPQNKTEKAGGAEQSTVKPSADEKKKVTTDLPPVNVEALPLGAKTFAFYGATYGCPNSKVYQEFLKKYKDGSLTNLPVEDGDPVLSADETWLKSLAEDEIDGDSPAVTTVEMAESQVKGLEKEDLHMLKDGEAEMPLSAQIFIRFVKVQGCQDIKLAQYQKFNEMFIAIVDKIRKEGQKYPAQYYVAKADTLLFEFFPK